MDFLVQFRRARRGVPEVVHTIPVAANDGLAALTRARTLVGTRFWPPRTDSLRVMDDSGRTLIDWAVSTMTVEPAPSSPAAGASRSYDGPRTPSAPRDEPLGKGYTVLTRHHLFDVGQSVAYAHGMKPDVWELGYEIVACCDPEGREPQYAIRNPNQHEERTVPEHELREDLGPRGRSH